LHWVLHPPPAGRGSIFLGYNRGQETLYIFPSAPPPPRPPDPEGSRGSLIPVVAPPRGLLASSPTTSRPCRDDLQAEVEKEGHTGAGEEREDDERGGGGAPAATRRPHLDEQGKEHAEMPCMQRSTRPELPNTGHLQVIVSPSCSALPPLSWSLQSSASHVLPPPQGSGGHGLRQAPPGARLARRRSPRG
jgi:hypothetical protein